MKKRVINKETVSNIQKQFDIDIIYLEYETESDPHGRDIFQKWGDAVMHVDTDYSIITTDKQFTIPNILSSGIRFLEENDDYVSIDFTKCRIQVSSNQYPIVYIDQIFTEGKISMDSPISRYETLCNQSGINAQLFAIYKTQTQKQMYNHISKLDIRFAEIYLNVSSAIYGKIMIVTELIAICRDLTFLYDNRGNVHLEESSTMRYPTLSEYKLSGVYNKYYNKFKNELNGKYL